MQRRILSIGVLALAGVFASGCRKDSGPATSTVPPESQTGVEGTPEQTRSPGEVFGTVLRFASADEVAPLLGDNVSVEFVGGAPPITGRDKVLEAMAMNAKLGALKVQRQLEAPGGTVVAQVDYVGTHSVSVVGEPPSGKPFGVRSIAIAKVEGGKLQYMRIYVNQAATFVQMGLVTNVPAGPVITSAPGEPEQIQGEPNAAALAVIDSLVVAVTSGNAKQTAEHLAPQATVEAHALGDRREGTSDEVAAVLIGERTTSSATYDKHASISIGEWVFWEGVETRTSKGAKSRAQPIAVLARLEGERVSEIHRYDNFVQLALPQLEARAKESADKPSAQSVAAAAAKAAGDAAEAAGEAAKAAGEAAEAAAKKAAD